MTHRFPIKEIALQAGLSTATVDRVINRRPNVSIQTRKRVADAIVELEHQEAQLSARGRRLFVDIVVEAPTRFSREIRFASEQVLSGFLPAVMRARFSMSETITARQTVAILDGIAKRGSHGVCLKARDEPIVREAIDRLAKRSIPVVTMFTDVASPGRLAYVGLDNMRAGRTAAYLMGQVIGTDGGMIVATRSDDQFAGEDERAKGFAEAIKLYCPNVRVVNSSGGGGLDRTTAGQVDKALAGHADVVGCYSMGGGNRAILEAFDRRALVPRCFVAHDLDEDNLALLRDRKLSFVLDHDLGADMRAAFEWIAHHHRLMKPRERMTPAEINVITPENIPSRIA